MACLYKRKNSPYYYIAWYNKIIGKAGCPISTRTTNRREAQMILREFITKKNTELNKKLVKQKPMLLNEARIFFNEKKKELSKKGMTLYNLSINHLIKAIGDIYITDIDHQSRFKFMEYLENRGIADSTKNIYLNHLKSFFNFFIKNEMLEKNYIKLIREKKKEIEIIPYKDIEIILNNIEGEKYFLIKFLLLTGLRVGEALVLEPKSINLETRMFRYKNIKAKKESIKPIIEPLYELLIQFEVTKREKMFCYQNFWGIASYWRRLMEKLNLKYNLHQLRKTCGSYLANIGVDIYYVQHYLGHSSVKVTDEYYVQANMESIRKDIDKKIKKDNKEKRQKAKQNRL